MGVNFGRLFIFLFICLIGQRVITYGVSFLCSLLGIYNPMLILIFIDIAIGFFLAWLYRPAEYRRGCFRDPNFYRDAGIFALVWLALDLVV